MNTFLFLFVALTTIVLFSRNAEQGKGGLKFAYTVLFAGLLFMLGLSLVNDYYQFTGTNDDYRYYFASKHRFRELSEWFDFSLFRGQYEQAGFPLVLTWLNQIVGDSLYARKALNLIAFLCLSVIWLLIGQTIGDRRTGRILASSILLATPLWYYWLFLLKDMIIVMLTSLYLLGLVRYISGKNQTSALLIIALSTLAMVPFRVSLVAVNIAMLAFSMLLQFARKKKFSRKITSVIMGSALVVGIIIFGTNSELLNKFGAAGENRSVDMSSLQRNYTRYSSIENSSVRSAMFPVLYLIGEVDAFNPHSWGMRAKDALWLRGMLQLPWALLGLPLFLLGIVSVWRKRKVRARYATLVKDPGYAVGQVRSVDKLDNLGLFLLLIFIVLYAFLSWVSTDSVRYRMPVFPVMVAFAGIGWMSLPTGRRIMAILGWALFVVVFAIIYYNVLK